MARYFFHVFDGADRKDSFGTLLRSHVEVRIHMLALAQTWIGLERRHAAVWRLEARDENQQIVGSIRFGDDLDDERSASFAL